MSGKAPDGRTWAEYYASLKPAAETDDEPDEKFELLETKLPLGELTDTQKRVWSEAELAGFHMEGYAAVVHFFDKIQKKDGKTAQAGEVTKAAHDHRNIFLGGYVPDSHLRFHASWLENGFRGFVWDPIGRYMYANSMRKDERQTYWVIRGVKEFEAWLDEWREKLTGDSRRLEKERKEAAALERKRVKQKAIYADYLEHQGIEWEEAA